MPDPAEYESEVQFVCDSGFVLNGPESATCEWDRNWTEQPVCERIRKYKMDMGKFWIRKNNSEDINIYPNTFFGQFIISASP